MDTKIIIGAVIAVIAIIGIGAFALGGGHTQHASNELVTCVAIHSGEPEFGFDPVHGWGYHESGTEPLIQSTLLKRDANNNFVNDLATNYTISSDFKEYTVDIRDDVKFTNGSKLTAKDVAFSYNKAKEYNDGADLSSMQKAKAEGDNKIVFTLNKPDSTFINKLADVGIVPEANYKENVYGQNPIGSGPYKLVQWERGQKFTLEKNPDYYGKEPYFDRITNLFLDADAAYSAAKNGDVDIAEIPAEYANETVKGYHIESVGSIDAYGISLPTQNNTGKTITKEKFTYGNNVTSDPAIREALNVGVNRTQLIQEMFNGSGNVSYTGIDSQLPWAYESTFKDGNVSHAKQILANAGWRDSDGDGIVDKNGKPASFSIYYDKVPERQYTAVAVAKQAKEIGINITPVGESWSDIEPFKYKQSVVLGYGSPDPYEIAHKYDSRLAGKEGYLNPEMLNDPAADTLIDQAMSQDLNSSYSTWSQAAQKANSNYPFLWIGTKNYTYLVSDSVDISNSTHLTYPHGGNIWGNIYDWKLIEKNKNDLF